jgi:hypothetical protein
MWFVRTQHAGPSTGAPGLSVRTYNLPKNPTQGSPKTLNTSVRKRHRGGRPTKRSDRWYALLALIYVTSDELSRTWIDTSGWGWEFSITVGRTTGRTITAKLVSLSASAVTNALTEAARRELFNRQIYRPGSKLAKARQPNRPGGRLTERGWHALGPASEEWRRNLGPTWRLPNPVGEVATGEQARAALLILRDELHAEAKRAEAAR